MPAVVTEYRHNYFNIFVQEKYLQKSTLVKDPVPSNVQEVKEMDELCYNFWRKKTEGFNKSRYYLWKNLEEEPEYYGTIK